MSEKKDPRTEYLGAFDFPHVDGMRMALRRVPWARLEITDGRITAHYKSTPVLLFQAVRRVDHKFLSPTAQRWDVDAMPGLLEEVPDGSGQ